MSRSVAQWLADAPTGFRRFFIESLTDEEVQLFGYDWRYWSRPEQCAPVGDWRLWLLMAGRGFGKTRAGAEWVRGVAEQDGAARIALIAANLGEARRIMVEGPSGLLAIAPPSTRPQWEPSLRRLRWPGGAEATLYSAAEPESLRGPEHSHSWCDEIAKWDNSSGAADAVWENMEMGLRLGAHPRICATTTPRPVPLLRMLLARADTRLSTGRTVDNSANLPPAYLAAMDQIYGGSALGRQELDGEMLAEVEGALWSRALLERLRSAPPASDGLSRVVVAVDPPAGTKGDACGIVVAGLDKAGKGHVLADCTAEGMSPEGWARAVANAAECWAADKVVAEANQGGAMVESVLRAADINLPVKLVHASRSKSARAEPVAALYEAERVFHAGTFALLEDQLCGMMAGGGYEGPGRSPDRADALVWALTELMLGRRGLPRIHM